MDDSDFEGTQVLEQLASVGLLDQFADAIDSDDFDEAANLMRQANIDAPTVAIVLDKMRDADSA